MELIIAITGLLISTYLGCGILFAIPFLAKGITMIDEGAKGSSTGFRLIILPGVIVLWPVLLRKWLHVKSTKHDEAS